MKQRSTLCIRGSLLNLSLFLFLFVHAQNLQIQGRVIESVSKKPVIGAAVEVKSTKKATITNSDGAFNITAKKGDELTVSYIGYQSKTTVVMMALFLKLKSQLPLIN